MIRSSPYDRQIFALAVPALGALIADPLVSLVDTAFVGHVSSEALAALGVNASVFAIAFYVFNFLSTGTTTIVAHAIGAGQVKEAGATIGAALWFAILVGIGLTLFLWVFADPILAVMGATDSIIPMARGYLRIRALAAPAVMIILVGNGAFRGFLDATTPLVIVVVVNLINLVLDPLFIFWGGYGAVGAAIATIIAQWAGAIWFLRLFAKKHAVFQINFLKPQWDIVGPLLKVGRDLSLRSLSLLIAVAVAGAVAMRMGIGAIAGHQIVLEVWWLLALVLDALGVSAQAILARYRGEKQYAHMWHASNRILQLGLMFGVGVGALTLLLSGWIPVIFTSDQTIITAVTQVLWVAAFMQPINAVVFIWDGIFLGAGQYGFLARTMFISSMLGVAVFFAAGFWGAGLMGLWTGFVVLYCARGVQFAWRYRALRWNT